MNDEVAAAKAAEREARNVERAAARAAVREKKAQKEALAKKAASEQRRLKKFGLTPEDFNALLESQGGKCAICRCELVFEGAGTANIDHDHLTGALRGILCGPCNLGLGNFHDDADYLLAAVSYLNTLTTRVVPGFKT